MQNVDAHNFFSFFVLTRSLITSKCRLNNLLPSANWQSSFCLKFVLTSLPIIRVDFYSPSYFHILSRIYNHLKFSLHLKWISLLCVWTFWIATSRESAKVFDFNQNHLWFYNENDKKIKISFQQVIWFHLLPFFPRKFL